MIDVEHSHNAVSQTVVKISAGPVTMQGVIAVLAIMLAERTWHTTQEGPFHYTLYMQQRLPRTRQISSIIQFDSENTSGWDMNICLTI